MPTQIKFGTSGWRAIVADEFTLENVRRAVTGIARYVASRNSNSAKLLVGRDPRFMGETFVAEAAAILSAHGIQPLVIPEAAPTPAIAYSVIRRQTDGSINFTASHNPPEYNGIKFSTPDGAPALPEVTKAIEKEIAGVDLAAPAGGVAGEERGRGRPHPRDLNVASADGAVEPQQVDVRPDYLDRLTELVDIGAIKKAGLRVVFDPFWGAARGYSDHLLRENGIAVEAVHDYRDVLFGGHAPEPEGKLLDECRARMKQMGAALGICTDGDADRFGIVDQDGTFLQPNYVIALLFDYLLESRAWKKGVGKSVATTNLLNAIADKNKLELHETPVGFKYIGELIKKDAITIGGEESAGLTIRYHVPEKDGIIAGLLCCEMVAVRKKSLILQLRELFGKVGSYYPVRENFRLTPEVKATFTGKLAVDPTEFAGRKVCQVVRTDGLKLILEDGSWVCYRLSGTEPVVRVYTEARSETDSAKLTEAARQWVLK